MNIKRGNDFIGPKPILSQVENALQFLSTVEIHYIDTSVIVACKP